MSSSVIVPVPEPIVNFICIFFHGSAQITSLFSSGFTLLSFTVSLERWCRLRGNLLFYFKTCDQWSEPLGVLVLEQCVVHIDSPSSAPPDGPFGFSLGKLEKKSLFMNLHLLLFTFLISHSFLQFGMVV